MNINNVKSSYKNGLIVMKCLQRLKKFGLTLELFYVHVDRNNDLHVLGETWEPMLEEYDSGFLHEEDMREVASSQDWQPEAMLLDRLQRGLKCFGVKHRGRIVSYLWCDFEEINAPCYKMKLKKSEVHICHVYTLREYRGKGLAPFMRYQCYDALNDMGIEKFYSHCDAFNTPSMRYKEKMNVPVQKVGFYCALGDKYSWNWILKDYGIQ